MPSWGDTLKVAGVIALVLAFLFFVLAPAYLLSVAISRPKDMAIALGTAFAVLYLISIVTRFWPV